MPWSKGGLAEVRPLRAESAFVVVVHPSRARAMGEWEITAKPLTTQVLRLLLY